MPSTRSKAQCAHIYGLYSKFPHMKITVEISDALLEEARRLASAKRTTLRVLIEEGLRHVVSVNAERRPFKLRDASFRGGGGFAPEFADSDWSKIRDAVYEGHGA